jgi:hypothetical protein
MRLMNTLRLKIFIRESLHYSTSRLCSAKKPNPVIAMKNYVVAFSFLFVITTTSAQDSVSYGNVSPIEFQMKECSFDKDANAVVLLDEAHSNYNEQYNLITSRHIRMKILKEKGIDYANISIPFYRKEDFETVYDVRAMVINMTNTGEVSKKEIERKLIYKKNTSELYGELSFAFPDIKVGSIIEYSYTSSMKHYGGLRDWFFQQDIPVVRSSYELYIIPGHEFRYQVYKSPKLNIDVKPDPANGSIKFEMKDIPGLEDEPYMDSKQDYIQRVVFQLSAQHDGFSNKKYVTSWDELKKEWLGRSDFGGQLNKDLPGTDEFIKTVKANSSAIERMKQIYRYVQSNVTWDGFNSIVSNNGVKSVWNRKKGNSGELNLILVNLLKAVDLEAYPILVSERSHGRVHIEYPFIDQFNTVYAAVFIEGKRYYLNAIDPLNPPHIIPHNILNTTAFIVNRKVGGLVNITNESLQYRENLAVIASLTPQGNIHGEAFLYSHDYARIFRLSSYKRNNESYISEHFKRPAFSIDSFKILNDDNDSLALQQNFKFDVPISRSGDYAFIPMTFFSGLENNPFLSSKRFSDINFGFKRHIASTTILTIPSNYVVDVLPKSLKLINPDQTVDFSREIIFDEANRKLAIKIKVDFKKSFYPVGEYESIREFYKKMFELLNEQVVLKTK